MAALSTTITDNLWIAYLLPFLYVLNIVVSYYRSPLKAIPGPFFAKFTNLWSIFNIASHHHQVTLQELHEKHGVAVRVGPNKISLGDPDWLRTVYDTRGIYRKVCKLPPSSGKKLTVAID